MPRMGESAVTVNAESCGAFAGIRPRNKSSILKRIPELIDFFQLCFEELVADFLCHAADLDGFAFEVFHPLPVLFVEGFVAGEDGIEGVVAD
jgi:hypothetical protein